MVDLMTKPSLDWIIELWSSLAWLSVIAIPIGAYNRALEKLQGYVFPLILLVDVQSVQSIS